MGNTGPSLKSREMVTDGLIPCSVWASLSLSLGSRCLPGPQRLCPASRPGRELWTCSPSSGSGPRPNWCLETAVGSSRYSGLARQGRPPHTPGVSASHCFHFLILLLPRSRTRHWCLSGPGPVLGTGPVRHQPHSCGDARGSRAPCNRRHNARGPWERVRCLPEPGERGLGGMVQ